MVRWWRHDSLFSHFGPSRNLERDDWVSDALHERYNTILLNTGGAHLQDYNGSIEIYTGIMKNILDLSRRLFMQGKIVVFRTTAPGHNDCMSFTSPSIEVPLMPQKYYWNMIPQMNEIARQILGNREEIRIMEIEHLTRLRPDCHINENDCLHIMDDLLKTWVSLFCKVLRLGEF